VKPALAIVGLGAVSSVGLYPEAMAAAVAGGISRFETHSAMRDARDGSPLMLALVARLPATTAWGERTAWMGARALAEATAPIGDAAGLRVSMLLSVPPPRPGITAYDTARLLRRLASGLRFRVSEKTTGLYDAGHDGAIAALQHARDLIADNQTDVCIVGGVDSYCDPDILDWLAKEGRLKGEDAPTGFVPGEGAAFVLVTGEETARRSGFLIRARIVAAARGQEAAPWYTNRPTQARGLTAAMAAALKALPDGERAAQTYSDANGEPWRADEWAFAYVRTGKRHADPLRLIHPADCWGDVGAASACLLLSVALVDAERGRARGPFTLLLCSGDMRPYRGAVLLERKVTPSPWA
jgi:3-oxoacyl-[acyl-carrier-protein] synthase-1